MRTPTFSRAFGAILRRRRAKGAPPTRRALFEPLEARELLDVAGGALQITDLSSRQTLADSATVYLSSFYADATGAPTLPDYGETVYRRLELANVGDAPLTLSSVALSSGSKVELVGSRASQLQPNERTIVALKWRALGAESSTLTIVSDDATQPVRTINLSGAVRANSYVPPQISTPTLLCDTGSSANDLITCNPTLAWNVAGDLYGGRIDFEFDLDGDSQVDATEEVCVSGAQTFDPSEYSAAFVAPDSGTRAVSLRLRPVIYDAEDVSISVGAWQTFSFTLEPAPSSALAVSNLSVGAGLDGDWTHPGAVALSGTASGSGDRSLQVEIGGSIYTHSISDSTFTVILEEGFPYGTTTTVRARVGQYDATTQRILYGGWSTLAVAPTPCAVASLALQTDDGVSATDNISSDLTLVGALASGVGCNYSEVEFSCGAEILGSAFTDDEGGFLFTPPSLPIVAGVASGAIVARAVYRPAQGSPVYGASSSIALTYAPDAASESYNLEVELVAPLASTSSTQATSNPTLAVSGSFPAERDVEFEFRWRQASANAWSSAVCAPGRLDDEFNEDADELQWSSEIAIPELYALAASETNIEVQIRPRLYDDLLRDYVSTSSWTTCAFLFQKPTTAIPTISTLALAAPEDATGLVASDPTLVGRISSNGNAAGVTINVYSSGALVGQTTTDASGAFQVRPTGLTHGSQTLSCAARVWDATTRAYVEGTPASVSFTYVPPTVAAPTLGELRLWDDTGVANDSITANAAIYGVVASSVASDDLGAYLCVEYDLDGDGTAGGTTSADASGEFFFTPQLAPGARTVGVRATRWDSANQTEVAGAWSSLSLTIVAGSGAAPTIAEYAPENPETTVSGVIVASDATISGRVSSESGYSDLVMEFETTIGGTTTTDSVAPDERGRFCWTPEVPFSTSDVALSVSARVGRFNATTQTTTWSAWSTTSFLVRGTTDSTISSVASSASDREDAAECELKISGEVAPGRGIRSYVVEYDLDGDGTPDGETTPNSNDRFVLYAVPQTSTLAVRVVDLLPDDSERVSNQGWTAIQTPTYATSSPETALRLYFDANDSSAYLQVENYQGAYANLVIAFDVDRDSEPDATLAPNAQGRVLTSALTTALAAAECDLTDGFFDAEWFQLSRVLAHQQMRIDSGLSVASDAFTNPTFDFEVCFVAGTPVLMADGTKKPIEEIQPGDLVLAADHLDPEGKSEPARIAQFFDNGLKEVVQLEFELNERIQCTLGHRFYVLNKGWVAANDLIKGDICIGSECQPIRFKSKEVLSHWQHVYNIEVERKHTYYVGNKLSVLVHNADCK